jgi:hypothetical protein
LTTRHSHSDEPPPRWWQTGLKPRLSQGDILADVPFCLPVSPIAPLRETQLKGGRVAWEASSRGALTRLKAHTLATHVDRYALVVSHDCELDKPKPNPVLVAPVLPIHTLTPDMQAKVLSQDSRSALPLPEVPGIGTMYAELRYVTALPNEFARAARRVASMGPEGKARLSAQLVLFLLRLRIPEDALPEPENDEGE